MTTAADALVHLDDERVNDAAAMLTLAARAGVGWVLNAGVDPRRPLPQWDMPAGVRLCIAAGVHPQHIDEQAFEAQLDALRAALDDKRVVAIGECGVDERAPASLDVQAEALDAQLALAEEHDVPVVLHLVRAPARLLAALDAKPGVRGFVHGFSGAPEVARELVKRGMHISFGGMVCRPTAKRAREAARAVPIERLLIESGTPDHPPDPMAARSDPRDLRRIAQELADLRDEDVDDVLKATCANFEALLGLGPNGT